MSQGPAPPLSEGRRFLGGESEQNKEIGDRRGREAVDLQAESSLVPPWILNVSIPALLGASHIPAAGRSASPAVLLTAASQTSRNRNCWCCHTLMKTLLASVFSYQRV